jgi:C-terminal processing protease CtpA/Prc
MGAEQSSDRLCGACSDGSEFSACIKRVGEEGPSREVISLSVIEGDVQANGSAGRPEQRPSQYKPPQQPDSWRFNAPNDDAVGVGAYFGRVEGYNDSVARVKSLVPGGPAEQTGIIEIGDALCAVDDVDVYGQPLCELGKHVLGPSGSVVKLSFEKRKSGERYVTHLVRGKGVLTVM